MKKDRRCKYCDSGYIYAKGMCRYHYLRDLRKKTKHKKKKPIKKAVSKTLRAVRKLYSRVRKEYFSLDENKLCRARVSEVCLIHATDIHHMAGRVGELLTNTNYFMPVCRMCHRYIHDHSAWAEENGFIVHVN